jgi:hypothetical protein
MSPRSSDLRAISQTTSPKSRGVGETLQIKGQSEVHGSLDARREQRRPVWMQRGGGERKGERGLRTVSHILQGWYPGTDVGWLS